SYLTAPPRVAASMIALPSVERRGRYDARNAAPGLVFARVLPRRTHRLRCVRNGSRAAYVAGCAGALRRGRARAGSHLARRGTGGGARGLAVGEQRAAHARGRAAAALDRTARDPPRRREPGARDARPAPPLPAQMTRVAAIDLGTNATRLLIADVEDGQVGEIVRRTRITRLGEGVAARRRLLPGPI